MEEIRIHLLAVFKASKTAKSNAAAKKCCGWEEPAICINTKSTLLGYSVRSSYKFITYPTHAKIYISKTEIC